MTEVAYIGSADREVVLAVAHAAQTVEVTRVLEASGDLRSLVIRVRLHAGVGDHGRVRALGTAARAAMSVAPATMEFVTVEDEQKNRAIARRRA